MSVLRAARVRTIAEYIAERRQNILRTIADRPILKEELSSEEEEAEEDVLAG